MNADIDIRRVTAPLAPEAAWEVESLLLKIFEYGDYSFRSALRGEYSETLDCSFFLARHQTKLIGAAGFLSGRRNPGVSILGPIGVDAAYRGNNVGSMLVKSAIDDTKGRDCKAIYLGTSDQDGIASFYEKLGFQRHVGIVMRYLMCREQDLENCFGAGPARVRRAVWGDFPGVCVLATVPSSFYTFDLPRGIFSSKYIEPTRFLTTFPRMMKEYARQGGFANVLATDSHQTIVGVAGINRLPSRARCHVAEFDFFVHDNFLEQAECLVRATLKQSKDMHVRSIICYCLGCDRLKRRIIDKMGGSRIAVLADNAFVDGSCEDVLVYQLKERIHAKG